MASRSGPARRHSVAERSMTDIAWRSADISAQRRSALADAAFRAITLGFALLVLVILGAVIVALVDGAVPALREFGWSFVVSNSWNPVKERFGAGPAIYG